MSVEEVGMAGVFNVAAAMPLLPDLGACFATAAMNSAGQSALVVEARSTIVQGPELHGITWA